MTEGEIVTNIEYDYPFAGKTYKIKRASLKQVMDFQRKAGEITKENDPAGDLRMAAYAIYLVLHTIDPTVTEEHILDNAPGDLDVMDTLVKLGFINQQKVDMMNKIRNSLVSPSTGGDSSRP